MAKTKFKPILPSLRAKKRYLVFEVITKEKVADASAVSESLLNGAIDLLGKYGAAKAGIIMLTNKWDEKMQRGIIKVSHKHVDALKASFAFCKKVNGREAIFRSLGVSGVLKKAESRFLRS